MTILVFGRTGQVATEIQRLADVMVVGREIADLSHPDSCAAIIRRHAPKAVINAAAYTAVDKAEDEEQLARIINRDAPAAMANACAGLQIPFVHLSTDYVFAGDGTQAWQPEDIGFPQNAYGLSKQRGEEAIKAIRGCYAILRTSWIFSAHGNNFVKTMLQLADTRNDLNIVSDQIGGPTPADAIAEACLDIANQLIANPEKSGIYHFSGSPNVSWYEFATEIFQQARKHINVTPISTKNYPTPANRPLNSRLNCDSTEEIFGIERPDWRHALNDILDELDKK